MAIFGDMGLAPIAKRLRGEALSDHERPASVLLRRFHWSADDNQEALVQGEQEIFAQRMDGM